MDWQALLISLFFALGVTPLAFFQSACPCCGVGCSFCSGGTRTAQVQIVLTGIVNGTDGTCTSCSSLNATWIVDAIPQVGAGTCFWTAAISVCTFNSIAASIGSLGVGVSITTGVFGQAVSYLSAGPNTCSTWLDENIAFDSASFEVKCDGTASTCLITAI
jgi:hypothetical protein